ncbi:hypothetical protein C3L33_19764, partial [Rhododendron williamsianum]
VQLVRIQLRVPEYGWTTQKDLEMMLLDLPGLLFFSTYTLLVLFWAEIYHQVCIWIYMRVSGSSAAVEVAKIFFSVPCHVGCSSCCNNSLLNLQVVEKSFMRSLCLLPLNSVNCSLNDLIIATVFDFESPRSCQIGWLRNCNLLHLFLDKMFYGEFLSVAHSVFNGNADVDVLDHPVLNFFYYLVILGAILASFILESYMFTFDASLIFLFRRLRFCLLLWCSSSFGSYHRDVHQISINLLSESGYFASIFQIDTLQTTSIGKVVSQCQDRDFFFFTIKCHGERVMCFA